jgi:hypothetical protein
MTEEETKAWRERLQEGDEVAVLSRPNYGDVTFIRKVVHRRTPTQIILQGLSNSSGGFYELRYRVSDGEVMGHTNAWSTADQVVPVAYAQERMIEQEANKTPYRKKEDRRAAIERALPSCSLETLNAVLRLIKEGE